MWLVAFVVPVSEYERIFPPPQVDSPAGGATLQSKTDAMARERGCKHSVNHIDFEKLQALAGS